MFDWILNKFNYYDDKKDKKDKKGEIVEIIEINEKNEKNEYINTLNSKAAVSLEETIMKIDSGSMEKVLQNLTISQIIKTLMGASDNLQNFVLSNIKGQATRLLIIDELKNAEIQNEKIIEAQEGVLKVVLRLRECGEI